MRRYDEFVLYTPMDYTGIDEKIRKKCKWTAGFAATEKSRAVRAIGLLTETRYQNNGIANVVGGLARVYNLLLKDVEENLIQAAEMTEKYLKEEITKLTLAEFFPSHNFKEIMSNIASLNNEMKYYVKDYGEKMSLSDNVLRTGYEDLLKLKLPVLNEVNVYDLKLVRKTQELNDSVLEGFVEGLKSEVNTSLTQLVGETYTRLMEPIENLTHAVTGPLDDILVQNTPLQQRLADYAESTKMDTEFYM